MHICAHNKVLALLRQSLFRNIHFLFSIDKKRDPLAGRREGFTKVNDTSSMCIAISASIKKHGRSVVVFPCRSYTEGGYSLGGV